MRLKIGLLVLAGLGAVLGFVAWPVIFSGGRLGAKPAALETAWQTEEEWLVDSIVRDVVEMAAFSSTGPSSRGPEISMVRPAAGQDAAPTFALSLPGSPVLQLVPARSASVWSPEEYEAIASTVLAALGGRPAGQAALTALELSVAEELTNPEPEVIEAANDRVSVALARNMRDSAAHEAAALVLEAFALREAADSYSDLRPTLCRATAHLAFAAALRGGRPLTTDGRLALLTHLVLSGREADAAQALRELEAEAASLPPAAAAWARALRLRLFEDTRGIEAPGTLLERRELYRASLWSVDARSVEQAALLDLTRFTDAWRLASEVGLSVGTGNVFMSVALEQELEEAREVYRRREGKELAEQALVQELNRAPERLATATGPRVISPGAWAAYHQRHIIYCIWRRNYHLREMLGLYAEADVHRREMAARFGQLSLGPLLTVRLALDATKGPGPMDALIEIAAQRPEAIPAGHWFAVEQVSAHEMVRRGMPQARKWFAPGVPRGTAFDVTQRGLAGLLPRAPEEMRRLHELSPADFATTQALLGALHRGRVPAAEIGHLHGDRALYDIRVLDAMVYESWGKPDSIGPMLERSCELLADRCFDYGFHLVARGQDAAAARAYRQGFDGAADRVLASNSVLWLVLHYVKEMKNADASEVAQAAAAVASYGGLRTLARYLEHTGDLEGAERVLQGARERYGNEPLMPEDVAEAKDGDQDEDYLLQFYYRAAFVRRAKLYEDKFWGLARDDFPRGLEKLERASLSGRPEDGVMVLTATDQAMAAGLRQGDIIVGVNGHRVRSRRQYLLVLEFTNEPDFLLDVFRHPAYVQIPARTPDHSLGFSMRTHGG